MVLTTTYVVRNLHVFFVVEVELEKVFLLVTFVWDGSSPMDQQVPITMAEHIHIETSLKTGRGAAWNLLKFFHVWIDLVLIG